MPALFYVSEVWATIAEDRRRRGIIEMKCRKDMYGVEIIDSVRNEEVYRRYWYW
jgi:hypothetical protein